MRPASSSRPLRIKTGPVRFLPPKLSLKCMGRSEERCNRSSASSLRDIITSAGREISQFEFGLSVLVSFRGKEKTKKLLLLLLLLRSKSKFGSQKESIRPIKVHLMGPR